MQNRRTFLMALMMGTWTMTGLAMGQILPPIDPINPDPITPGPITPGDPFDPTPVIPPITDPTGPISPVAPPLVAPFTPVQPVVITEQQPPALCGTAAAPAAALCAAGLMLMRGRRMC
jgi:hypothetical protein